TPSIVRFSAVLCIPCHICQLRSILRCNPSFQFFFFFNAPATTEIYTLSLHDALPIYLNAKGALTYTDIAGDPVLYGNLPPREISMKDVFRSGDSSKKFKIAEGQWYRYAPSYVSPAYHLLEGFPFIQEPPSGDLQ